MTSEERQQVLNDLAAIRLALENEQPNRAYKICAKFEAQYESGVRP